LTLHIDRSTVGRETPLAPLSTEAEATNRRQAGAKPDDATRGQDQAAISQQGQRLAGLNDGDKAQLDAVAAADELVRRLMSQVTANPEAAKAAHGNLDPSRVAGLLE
jgi:hypothetical protein